MLSYPVALGLVLAGLALIGLSLFRPVTFWEAGQATTAPTWALTAGSALRGAGVTLGPGDVVSPAPDEWLWGLSSVRIRRAQPVQIWDGGKLASLLTPERRVANLLGLAGLRLFPGDGVWVDGLPAQAGDLLEGGRSHTLVLKRAVPVALTTDGSPRVFYSSAATLGEALWEAGITVSPADRLTPGLDTPLGSGLQASLAQAQAYTITTPSGPVKALSAASTTGEVLREAGVALQGLDASQPPAGAPAPADGQIHLVRVRDEILLENQPIPFKSTYQPDPNTELDQTSVIKPGIPGLQVKRVRVRYEDGQEIARQDEGSWLARSPQDQVLGFGTQAVVHTEVVDGVTIEYWRKVTVYATSYSPCNTGAESCSGTTASGTALQHGVAAVVPAWYYQMRGQQVYVPGYGTATIADMGYGPGTSRWIDLGYSDSDYVGWHSNVTIYFLTPIPANIPWTLP